METYRIINRELSLNNQELRNALNKLKHEVTYLNRQLFEQREQFNNLKESIANAIEKKYLETISLIYPDKILNLKSPNRMNFDSHRRSCHNVTAADTLKKRLVSPTAKSPRTELMVDLNLKSPVPRVTIQRDIRISKSPQENLNKSSEGQGSITDLQISTKDVEEGNSNNDSKNDSMMSQSVISMNISLGTINEEMSSGVDMRNETLTDATINNLLDAPCSTPYNQNKITTQFITGKKEMRVLVQKLSVEKIAQIRANSYESNSSQLNSSEYNTVDYNSTVKLQKERKRSEKDESDVSRKSPKRKAKQKLSKSNKSAKRNQNAFKENQVSESENTSDDESISKCLRRKRKPVCLKEPSLRQKLRNTTNLKI